jgi:hypothetical protein
MCRGFIYIPALFPFVIVLWCLSKYQHYFSCVIVSCYLSTCQHYSSLRNCFVVSLHTIFIPLRNRVVASIYLQALLPPPLRNVIVSWFLPTFKHYYPLPLRNVIVSWFLSTFNHYYPLPLRNVIASWFLSTYLHYLSKYLVLFRYFLCPLQNVLQRLRMPSQDVLRQP